MEKQILLQNLGLSDINPRICGMQDCEPGHCYGPAVRSYLLLHYVLSGRGSFETGGQCYPVGEGQLFVIHPGELTRYTADLETPWSYCWIGFDSSLELPGCLEQPVVNARNCQHIFRSICSQKESAQGMEWYLCGKLYELLSLLCHDDGAGSAAAQYVSRAKNYLESSYMEELSVDRLARYLGLDRSYFCRIFTALEGISPSGYLVSLRLNRAAELLATQGCTPREAADRCGYNSPENFSRMFKRQFGVPPSRYRDNPPPKDRLRP